VNELRKSYWDYEDRWKEVVGEIFPELTSNNLVQLCPASMFGTDNFLSWPEDKIISEVMLAYNNGKRIFVYECLREALVIKSISKFITITNKINLPESEFIWLTGDPNAEEIANKRIPNKKFSVRGAFYFEYIAQKVFIKYNTKYRAGLKEKTFLCLNNVARQSRIDLLEYMLQYDLVKDSYYSFLGSSRSTISTHDLVNIPGIDKVYPNIVNNKNILPLKINDTLTNGELWCADLLYEDVKFYENSYFSVIPETIFYDAYNCPYPNIGHVDALNGTFITEKTYKTIIMKHPFILLARPHALRLLKSRGYKTFSPFIDESYDEIIDDNLRLKAVADEIYRLSKTNLVEFTYHVKDIVEHNAKNFWNQTIFDPNKI
jgi:hypothetical protein